MIGFNWNRKRQTFQEKIDMYDMIIANLLAGSSIIEPEYRLDNSQIAIGFSNIASERVISKYFMILNFQDWMSAQFLDEIRSRCLFPGVKIDFYIYGQPHEIKWDSPEMKNKVSIWKNYVNRTASEGDVFEYRQRRDEYRKRKQIIQSTKYLNEAELDYKRTTMKVSFVVKITGRREEESILNLGKAIRAFKSINEIKTRELRVNMIDWLRYLSVFSLKGIREVATKMPKKIMTDDILANFNSYKQGRVGNDGVVLGIDVLSMVPVMRKFKADPDSADNWLISAGTGGGKSYFVKALLTYLLADGFVVTVMDYEGDEYNNLANYVRAGNPEDVKIISMGKGSMIYFDPMEIAELTGDWDTDSELKETSFSYTLAVFRVISGMGESDRMEEKVISTAIRRVYDGAGVTEEPETWYRSKQLNMKMVYEELKDMMESKEFVDESTDNIKHKALSRLVENLSVYFEEGEAKAGTFRQPMSVNELFKARLLIFSFGMKGAVDSQTDPVMLALKQLSVANVSNRISNHCKYVKHCFNVKVWEEYQRWGTVKGTAEIISNAMTGGRKRGDVNIVITNDLNAMLDKNNELSERLSTNIQSFAIGMINNRDLRKKFCEKFDLQELEPTLDMIAKAGQVKENAEKDFGMNNGGNRYKHAFCIATDSGKAVVKVMLPSELRKSKIFKTGVDTDQM